MFSDPIADFCTRIRNGYLSQKTKVIAPSSKVILQLVKIIKKEGYIKDFIIKSENPCQKTLEITLAYNKEGKPLLTKIERVSKPGLRIYQKSKKISKVLSGFGVSIISTPKGLMTGDEAKKKNLGGEVICQLW